MAEPDARSAASPAGLSFGELLNWHLMRGTRPQSSARQGRRWGKKEFANAVGVTDRQVRFWLRGESRPAEIETIEGLLFGGNQADYVEWRLELRRAHERAWSGSAPGNGVTTSSKGSPAALAVSNIPILVPLHFMGRDDALAAVEAALDRYERRVAITALHGLRGVGKTTLAAAFAERHRGDFRATWWVRAQTEATLRADLAALGVRLGWVAADAKEEPAVAAVMERLWHEGQGILLIFDNATEANALKPYLPRGGEAQVIVTSNAHAWRGIAEPVELRLWPKEIGAHYLVARTGREDEQSAAESLSEALGGLPLAHEQAAAYCERLDVSLAEYQRRFLTGPMRLLGDARHAPTEYHDGLTVASTFALAIEEAAKLHPAAEPLIAHAAQLAPEPIPLFLFAEARETFGEPLATALEGDGLDEVVAALRAFALVERQAIQDERDPAIVTDTIRLHRLVREVAVARCASEMMEGMSQALVKALAALYPPSVDGGLSKWPRARRLEALARALVDDPQTRKTTQTADLLHAVGLHRHVRAAYQEARPLLERALAMREEGLGPDHPDTARSLMDLGRVLLSTGDLPAARRLFERVLAIREKVLGPEHESTGVVLDSLGRVLRLQGDFAGARPLLERVLAIREKVLGPEHSHTGAAVANLARLFHEQGDLAGAKPLVAQALAISENVRGPGNPHLLHRLGILLQSQGDLAGARPLFERAVTIAESMWGPDHPNVGTSLYGVGIVLQQQGDLAGAQPLLERALRIHEKVFGPDHPRTAEVLNDLGRLLEEQGDSAGARLLLERALTIGENVLGPEHPHTATSLNNLGFLLQAQGDLAGARPLLERALAILEKALGGEHPNTHRVRRDLAVLLLSTGEAAEALAGGEAALAAHEKALGSSHPWTKDSARVTANALTILGRSEEAAALRDRFGLSFPSSGAG